MEGGAWGGGQIEGREGGKRHAGEREGHRTTLNGGRGRGADRRRGRR